MRKVTRNRLLFAAVVLAALWVFGSYLITLLILGAIGYGAWRWLGPIITEHRREQRLRERYSGQELEDLIAKVIWEGESADQIRDSLGPPIAVESHTRKTKHKEVWKYGHEGGNRYRLRITLDDGQVVSWRLRD